VSVDQAAAVDGLATPATSTPEVEARNERRVDGGIGGLRQRGIVDDSKG